MQEMTQICTSASLHHKAEGIWSKNQHIFTLSNDKPKSSQTMNAVHLLLQEQIV